MPAKTRSPIATLPLDSCGNRGVGRAGGRPARPRRPLQLALCRFCVSAGRRAISDGWRAELARFRHTCQVRSPSTARRRSTDLSPVVHQPLAGGPWTTRRRYPPALAGGPWTTRWRSTDLSPEVHQPLAGGRPTSRRRSTNLSPEVPPTTRWRSTDHSLEVPPTARRRSLDHSLEIPPTARRRSTDHSLEVPRPLAGGRPTFDDSTRHG